MCQIFQDSDDDSDDDIASHHAHRPYLILKFGVKNCHQKWSYSTRSLLHRTDIIYERQEQAENG